MTTINALAAELGFQPYGLRAFADDLLDSIEDDRAEIPADVEAIIREAATGDRLVHLADDLDEARDRERTVAAEMANAVEAAVAAGMSKYRVGQLTGLARGTVDKWAAGQR